MQFIAPHIEYRQIDSESATLLWESIT